ncbi:MAG: uracil-DNA glycosylase family protein [Aestuariivirga sp.]|uniref:uracil-DNA glycosylase family protein n=1 Tax=Aestuariivirga sp. TaxID=2650926 RepID=UPI0025C620F6|nr:uracil-DNA glycosylase family protein [Aestuariivirga sp.]MCA3562201.1 uracil-DNA glycosylase family protein [Aestuariivirga sp.]
MDLDELLAGVHACRICADAAKPLPHAPRPVLQPGRQARILIAGQAPGVRVHASGKPFTDPSGVRLRAWLGVAEATFYDPRQVAILPMGFCFPGLDAKGSDLPPRPECSPAWRAPLMAEMPEIELVVCLGAYAMRWHMRDAWPGSVDAAVKTWRAGLKLTPPVIALPHPSWRNSGWLKRNPWFAAELVPELRTRVARLLGPPA